MWRQLWECPGRRFYKRYRNKKDLFRSVIEFGMRSSKEAAIASLGINGLSPKERLLSKAVFCWGGQHIERMRSSPHSFEVIAFANAEMKDHARAMERENILRLALKCC